MCPKFWKCLDMNERLSISVFVAVQDVFSVLIVWWIRAQHESPPSSVLVIVCVRWPQMSLKHKPWAASVRPPPGPIWQRFYCMLRPFHVQYVLQICFERSVSNGVRVERVWTLSIMLHVALLQGTFSERLTFFQQY